MTTLRAVRHRDDDYRSFFDPITGLPKRSLLRDRLIMSLSRPRRDNLYVGLISVSVSFEPLRSNQATITALRDVAIRLTSLLRPDDTAARVEDAAAFIVVCNDLAADDHLDAIAMRLHTELSMTLAFDSEPVEVLVVVTSQLAGFDDDPERLLDDAARAALSQ